MGVFPGADQEFSPHTWGCFCVVLYVKATISAFPTQVRVFPYRLAKKIPEDSFPHSRGGVS